MFKLVVTMRKRDDLTNEEFVQYYEDRHLPFLKNTIPAISGTSRTHYRNFPLLNDPFLQTFLDGRGVVSNPDFDCMTEVIYQDRESANAYFKSFFSPENLEKIKQDESNFVKLDSIRFHVVDCIKSTRTV
ncbi:MAG: hypothetical protein EOP21_03300 [Hyphomicrobiales bacterium]|nr:MAG: hypothetical protein EOP21_03300 [Hyphomicrobiales bacterium]